MFGNDKVSDDQHGFRKDRSTKDQILGVTNVIDIRKHVAQIYVLLIFKKAYDTNK